MRVHYLHRREPIVENCKTFQERDQVSAAEACSRTEGHQVSAVGEYGAELLA